MYFLALHPDVCGRLREEVLETFGPAGAPTYADLKTMGYRTFHIIYLPHTHTLPTLTAMQCSTCRPQRDAPHLPVRPARRAHLARRPAHHPKHERGQPVPPAQDTNNDVLPPRTQANRPMGPRRRSVPPRTVVRARAARQGRAHTVHVLAVLRRSTRRESTHPPLLSIRVSD